MITRFCLIFAAMLLPFSARANIVPALALAGPIHVAAPDDCSLDTTAQINDGLRDFGWVTLTGCHLVSETIILPSGSTLTGNRNATLLVDPQSKYFRVTDPAQFNFPTRQSALIWGHSAKDIFVEGLTIKSDRASPYILHAVLLTNVHHANLRNLTISGFSNAKGIIRLDTTYDSLVESNHISRGTTRNDWQLTGIAIDEMAIRNDQEEKVWSNRVTVRENTIFDLSSSEDMLSRRRFETDGINVGGIGTKGVVIERNRIWNVGEAIDSFGSDGIISDNDIRNVSEVGIKLIHGASNNRVSGNFIDSPGMFGIAIGESLHVKQDATNNRIGGNTIIGRKTDWFNEFKEHNTQAAFAILASPDATSRVTDTVFSGNIIVDRGDWRIATLCERPLAEFANNNVPPNSDRGCAIETAEVRN